MTASESADRHGRKPLSPDAEIEAIEARVRGLPPRAGLFLIFTGTIGGLCVPGLPGFAVSLMGGMIVAPKTKWLQGTDAWLKENAPALRAEGLRFTDRFFRDLERRFPNKRTR